MDKNLKCIREDLKKKCTFYPPLVDKGGGCPTVDKDGGGGCPPVDKKRR